MQYQENVERERLVSRIQYHARRKQTPRKPNPWTTSDCLEYPGSDVFEPIRFKLYSKRVCEEGASDYGRLLAIDVHIYFAEVLISSGSYEQNLRRICDAKSRLRAWLEYHELPYRERDYPEDCETVWKVHFIKGLKAADGVRLIELMASEIELPEHVGVSCSEL